MEGVGRMIEIAMNYAPRREAQAEVGVCGGHGGDPKTVAFCYRSSASTT